MIDILANTMTVTLRGEILKSNKQTTNKQTNNYHTAYLFTDSTRHFRENKS